MSASDELAAAAARLVIDEGLEYAAAKRKAARALGPQRGASRPERRPWPLTSVHDGLEAFAAWRMRPGHEEARR